MKKLITLIVVASLALTMQAQDVTNKLGAGGQFSITDESDNQLFNIRETMFNDYYEFKNVNAHSHFSFYNSSNAGELRFDFFKSRGTITSPSASANTDILGDIRFNGYGGGTYQLLASIRATINGTVSGTTIPTELGFFTTTTNSPTERMTIKPDGTVNIVDLAGSYTNGEAYVIVNDAGDLIAQDAAPAKSVNNQIQQLKEENAALKAEMAELRKMVEMLVNDK